MTNETMKPTFETVVKDIIGAAVNHQTVALTSQQMRTICRDPDAVQKLRGLHEHFAALKADLEKTLSELKAVTNK